MAAVVAHHAFGLAGGAGGVQHIQRIGGGQTGTGRRFGARYGLAPVHVTPRNQIGMALLALQDQTVLDLVAGQCQGLIEQRFVGNQAPRLKAAGCRHHQFGLRSVDAFGQLGRGETAEHHRVNGADAGTGQHGHGRFRHHRHVNHHAVAFFHTQLFKGAGHACHFVTQSAIAVAAFAAAERRVVDQCVLIAATRFDVAIERVVAGVDTPAGKPAVKRCAAVIEDGIPGLLPVQVLGLLGPERRGVSEGALIFLGVAHVLS